MTNENGLTAADIGAVVNGGNRVDKLCALELDGVKQRNADLLAENTSLKFANSQTAQTAAIEASQAAQTANLLSRLAPNPIPAYAVQNPNCCSNYGWNNCGCNG